MPLQAKDEIEKMKIIKFIIIFAIAVGIIYTGAVLLGFAPKPTFLDKGISGNAEVKVTLLMDNNVKNPVSNVEIDLSSKPGQPPKGGSTVTNEKGVAVFNVKPGNYYIYFNENTFPKNLKVPEPAQINVVEGKINVKTIFVTTK